MMHRVTITLSFTTWGSSDFFRARTAANDLAEQLLARGYSVDTVNVNVKDEPEPKQ